MKISSIFADAVDSSHLGNENIHPFQHVAILEGSRIPGFGFEWLEPEPEPEPEPWNRGTLEPEA